MTVKVQIKRGSSTTLGNGVLSEGELGYTTNTQQVFIGNSSTNPILVGKCLSGLKSVRPTASINGQLYYATDKTLRFWFDLTYGCWFIDML